MAEYKIAQLGQIPPKEWSFQAKDGKTINMKTYKVKLEGNPNIIDINRVVTSPAPQVGEKLEGEIEPTDFGFKFKAAKKPFTPGGGYVKDDKEIRAQVAIKEANQFAIHYMEVDHLRGKELSDDKLERLTLERAVFLYGLADILKNGEGEKYGVASIGSTTQASPQLAGDVSGAQTVENTTSSPKPPSNDPEQLKKEMEAVLGEEAEKVDLSEIPF